MFARACPPLGQAQINGDLSGTLRKAPVPRLVGVAARVAARVGKPEAERAGMGRQPGECRRMLELELERPAVFRADIDGATRVVLAVPGRRADLQDLLDRQAALELGANDLGLARDAAKRRDRIESRAARRSRRLHLAPRLRRLGRE